MSKMTDSKSLAGLVSSYGSVYESGSLSVNCFPSKMVSGIVRSSGFVRPFASGLMFE